MPQLVFDAQHRLKADWTREWQQISRVAASRLGLKMRWIEAGGQPLLRPSEFRIEHINRNSANNLAERFCVLRKRWPFGRGPLSVSADGKSSSATP
jgi:hypothetical protein